MNDRTKAPSARKTELLEAAYNYALAHGLAELSLRPLAAAIGSSPRVLLYLYGTKEGLVRALLARARTDELALLSRARAAGSGLGLGETLRLVWTWLSAEDHRSLLCLWVEAYGRALIEPERAVGRVRPANCRGMAGPSCRQPRRAASSEPRRSSRAD